MTVSRRRLAASAAALAAVAALPRPAFPAETPAALRAAPAAARLAPRGVPDTAVWAYEGRVPGPTLRVPAGGRITRRFVNGLPQASTIHWHGIRIANAMDGVPGLTQPTVPSGGEFLYDFVAPDAGTYWYHPHDRTWEQMARGLYGALIVEEAAPPDVDRDEALLIDDWRLTADGAIDESFGAMMDWSHAGRLGNWVTVNGDGALTLPARRYERWRLRLANTANARVFSLGLQGLEGWTVALDGQPLAAPEPAGRLELAPAQRADLIVDVTADSEAFLVSVESDGGYAAVTFAVDGAARPARLPAPPPLPPGAVPPLGDLDTARRTTLRMEGGAMGGLAGATVDGRYLGMRDLVGRGMAWALNGIAGRPAAPLLTASVGETVRLAMVNDTAWPHAMHLHGHHVRRLGADGTPGPLRDTLLVARGETAEVAFVADNPGKWLLHCHMLEHAAAGMTTWLEVG